MDVDKLPSMLIKRYATILDYDIIDSSGEANPVNSLGRGSILFFSTGGW